MFNPGDEDANVVVGLDTPIAQAFAVNFLEERQNTLKIEGGGIARRLTPRQIQTIEILS